MSLQKCSSWEPNTIKSASLMLRDASPELIQTLTNVKVRCSAVLQDFALYYKTLQTSL